MTRLFLCILILGGTVAFLSCSDSLDGNTGAGGKGGGGGSTTHTDGTGPAGGTGGYCGTGCDGTGPAGGRGGTTGVAGRGGTGGTIGPCDGIGTGCGGRGGSFDGSGPIAGRGGTTGGGGIGGVGGTSGGGGTLGPCDGLGYFQQRGWCASTYAVQATKQIAGVCVFTGTCDFRQVWTTRNASLGDSLVCAYDGAGNLASARVCAGTPMPAWNCNGAATSPDCLSVGSVPDVQACALTTMCGSGFDGAGPVGGRGGG